MSEGGGVQVCPYCGCSGVYEHTHGDPRVVSVCDQRGVSLVTECELVLVRVLCASRGVGWGVHLITLEPWMGMRTSQSVYRPCGARAGQCVFVSQCESGRMCLCLSRVSAMAGYGAWCGCVCLCV